MGIPFGITPLSIRSKATSVRYRFIIATIGRSSRGNEKIPNTFCVVGCASFSCAANNTKGIYGKNLMRPGIWDAVPGAQAPFLSIIRDRKPQSYMSREHNPRQIEFTYI
jgi:hypothetical protein